MNSGSNAEHAGHSRDDAFSNLIKQVQNEKTQDYIMNRVVQQMKWYSYKSRNYKKKYCCWMTVAIMLGALIPVVSVFAGGSIWAKALLAALGATVTACNAYLSLHDFKDLWMTYQKTRETLLRTLYLYFNNVGVFSQNDTQEKKDALLITICEDLFSNEIGGWQTAVEKYTYKQ